MAENQRGTRLHLREKARPESVRHPYDEEMDRGGGSLVSSCAGYSASGHERLHGLEGRQLHSRRASRRRGCRLPIQKWRGRHHGAVGGQHDREKYRRVEKSLGSEPPLCAWWLGAAVGSRRGVGGVLPREESEESGSLFALKARCAVSARRPCRPLRTVTKRGLASIVPVVTPCGVRMPALARAALAARGTPRGPIPCRPAHRRQLREDLSRYAENQPN